MDYSQCVPGDPWPDAPLQWKGGLTPLFSPIYTSARPYSQTKSNTQRALMLPDEILRMDNRACLVLLWGQKPLRLCKITPDEYPGFGRLRDVRVSDYIPRWRQEEAKQKPPAPPEGSTRTEEAVPASDTEARAAGSGAGAGGPTAGNGRLGAPYVYGLLDPELDGFGAQAPDQDARYGAFDLMETPPQDVGGAQNEEGRR